MDEQNRAPETPEGAPPPTSETPESPPSATPEPPPPMMAETTPPTDVPPPPPAVTWTPPAAMAAPMGGRVTALAKVASAVLIGAGLLLALFGLLALGLGGLVGAAGQGSGLPELAGVFGAIVATAGIFALFFGVLILLSGVGAWRGNSAGRIGGIIFGALGALGSLSGLSSSDSAGGSLVGLLLFGFVAVVLAFRWKEPASA